MEVLRAVRQWWHDRQRLGITATPALPRPPARLSMQADRRFRTLLGVFAGVIVLLIGAMVILLVSDSLTAWQHFGIVQFITGTDWNPPFKIFGALPYIYGTIVTSVMALIIATPIGIGCAVFLTEFAPRWVRTPLSLTVEMLASVPSVVFGLWGIFYFAPWLRGGVEQWLTHNLDWIPLFKGPAFGIGIFAAGFILSIMIVPYITAITREVMLKVPTAQREGMLALGATRWEVVRMVVVPFARSGIVGGAILALGRALGETMAVTMLIGNRGQIKPSLFAQGATMSSVLANEFTEATFQLYTSSLIAIGLLLLVVALIMNILGRWLVSFSARNEARGGA